MSKKRTVLRLKKEYKNKIVRLNIPKMGELTFDTAKIPASEYEQYKQLGFGHCFDEVDQVDASEKEVNEMREAMAKETETTEEEELIEDEDEVEALEEIETTGEVKEIIAEKPKSTPKPRGTKKTK